MSELKLKYSSVTKETIMVSKKKIWFILNNRYYIYIIWFLIVSPMPSFIRNYHRVLVIDVNFLTKLGIIFID